VNGLYNNPPAAGTVDLAFPGGNPWGTFTVDWTIRSTINS
jgi:hypothetical protein